jgi:hypothetical protein
MPIDKTIKDKGTGTLTGYGYSPLRVRYERTTIERWYDPREGLSTTQTTKISERTFFRLFEEPGNKAIPVNSGRVVQLQLQSGEDCKLIGQASGTWELTA